MEVPLDRSVAEHNLQLDDVCKKNTCMIALKALVWAEARLVLRFRALLYSAIASCL